MARELAYRATGETDSRIFALGPDGGKRFWKTVSELLDIIKEKNFTPICLRKEGLAAEFACIPIRQYGAAMELVPYESFSALLDDFYAVREQQERTNQRGADLIRTVTTVRDRLRRKLAQQERDYLETQESGSSENLW